MGTAAPTAYTLWIVPADAIDQVTDLDDGDAIRSTADAECELVAAFRVPNGPSGDALAQLLGLDWSAEALTSEGDEELFVLEPGDTEEAHEALAEAVDDQELDHRLKGEELPGISGRNAARVAEEVRAGLDADIAGDHFVEGPVEEPDLGLAPDTPELVEPASGLSHLLLTLHHGLATAVEHDAALVLGVLTVR